MTRAGNWKVALLIGGFAAVGVAYAADPATAADASKDKSQDKAAKTSVAPDKDKGAKAMSKSGSASKSSATTTALDPGLEVPSARNRPATAPTPTTGTRGFPKKTPDQADKAATDAATTTGATTPATGK